MHTDQVACEYRNVINCARNKLFASYTVQIVLRGHCWLCNSIAGNQVLVFIIKANKDKMRESLARPASSHRGLSPPPPHTLQQRRYTPQPLQHTYPPRHGYPGPPPIHPRHPLPPTVHGALPYRPFIQHQRLPHPHTPHQRLPPHS